MLQNQLNNGTKPEGFTDVFTVLPSAKEQKPSQEQAINSLASLLKDKYGFNDMRVNSILTIGMFTVHHDSYSASPKPAYRLRMCAGDITVTLLTDASAEDVASYLNSIYDLNLIYLTK